jgi:hypothetical protein
MKTKDFASDAEVAALVDAFENATIPASEFTHVAHIAVAVSYLAQLAPDQALDRMREKIRAFAAHHGVDGLYHETLTTFWMRLLDHVAGSYDVAEPCETGQLLQQETTPSQKDAKRRSWATQLIDPIGCPSGAKPVDPSRRSSPRRMKAELPLWRRINLIVERWGTRAPVDAHYTRELIASKAARERWIPPDRLPLPF